jgi:hypothetical protein
MLSKMELLTITAAILQTSNPNWTYLDAVKEAAKLIETGADFLDNQLREFLKQ